MIYFQIQDIKDFMSRLLLSPAFDAFLVVEGRVTNFRAFVIDGRMRTDYYAKEEQEALGLNGQHFTRWQEPVSYTHLVPIRYFVREELER